jgi:hypothetical protein
MTGGRVVPCCWRNLPQTVPCHWRATGRSAFLGSYFGSSLVTILYRLVAGQPVDVMKSSPHERAAYQLEERFAAWHALHP